METEMKIPMAEREKWWSELTDTQKIDRMRQMVKGLMEEVRFLGSRLETLEDHVHVGEHLYTRRQSYGVGEVLRERSPNDNEVFF